MNMIKMCIGSGCIAIPYAANEGGIIFHIIGLGVITLWNLYSVHRLDQSRSYIKQKKGRDENGFQKRLEPDTNSAFGVIAWHAFGSVGLHFVDTILVLLMIGIIVAYEGKRRFLFPDLANDAMTNVFGIPFSFPCRRNTRICG